MIAVDTNILVRYITGDDEVQSKLASTLLDQYAGKEKSILINNIVLCELIWVLSRGYKYSKEQITGIIKTLLTTIEFDFEDHEIAFLAALEYETSKADYSDILIGLTNHRIKNVTTYSFDQNALKSKYFKNPE